MVLPQKILLIPLALAFVLIGTFNGILRQMDKNLNYSMKKKVTWGPFKYFYTENRRDESLHGPVLEYPNRGVYKPIATLMIIFFSIMLIALTWALILALTQCTIADYQIFLFTILGMTVVTAIITVVLFYVYVNKYAKHQKENIRKIADTLRENNK